MLFFNNIVIYIAASVMKTLKTSTEHEVNGAIGAFLKYAPDRRGGGGRILFMSMQFNDIIMYTDLCENKSIHNMLRLVFYKW